MDTVELFVAKSDGASSFFSYKTRLLFFFNQSDLPPGEMMGEEKTPLSMCELRPQGMKGEHPESVYSCTVFFFPLTFFLLFSTAHLC